MKLYPLLLALLLLLTTACESVIPGERTMPVEANEKTPARRRSLLLCGIFLYV